MKKNTAAIFDRIKFDGPVDGSPWLICKYNSEQFVLGSQMIVNQGQEALFFKGGKALDLFGPGTHTLVAGNLPVLHKLVNLPFGGKTPFTAEIYYVNKTDNLDIKWGTSSPVLIEDPKYGLILHISARGQYGVRVKDARLFVSRLIGALPGGARVDHLVILKYFNGLINSKIKSVTAGCMMKRQISFLEISQYLSELSEDFRKLLSSEFDRFGLETINFYCEDIAPKPGEYDKLQRCKEDLSLGRDFYQQRRYMEILEKLVSNSSSGAASTVLELGMSLGMAGQAGNALARTGNNLSGSSQPKPRICPRCGAQNNPEMKFCGKCGASLITSEICPHCNADIPAGMNFCGKCGQRL